MGVMSGGQRSFIHPVSGRHSSELQKDELPGGGGGNPLGSRRTNCQGWGGARRSRIRAQ